MKKAIALLLCLLMVTSLVACGSNNTATDDSQTSQVETENNETSTPEESEETPTEAETETPAESEEPTEEPEPSFDSSWASNEFEALLPELPFTGWTVEKETNSYYEMMTSELANDESDLNKMTEYVESLKTYGFIVETGERQGEWLITDSIGNIIEISCSRDRCFITISKKLEAISLGEQFPAIPDASWQEKEETTDTFCYLYTDAIYKDDIIAYGDKLLTDGYQKEEGEPSVKMFIWTFTNEQGDSIKIKYQGEEVGNCYITIRLGE